MKAFIYERYGSPDVLKLAELAKPTPGEGEVLVEVDVISLNPADWRMLRADPSFSSSFVGFALCFSLSLFVAENRRLIILSL